MAQNQNTQNGLVKSILDKIKSIPVIGPRVDWGLFCFTVANGVSSILVPKFLCEKNLRSVLGAGPGRRVFINAYCTLLRAILNFEFFIILFDFLYLYWFVPSPGIVDAFKNYLTISKNHIKDINTIYFDALKKGIEQTLGRHKVQGEQGLYKIAQKAFGDLNKIRNTGVITINSVALNMGVLGNSNSVTVFQENILNQFLENKEVSQFFNKEEIGLFNGILNGLSSWFSSSGNAESVIKNKENLGNALAKPETALDVQIRAMNYISKDIMEQFSKVNMTIVQLTKDEIPANLNFLELDKPSEISKFTKQTIEKYFETKQTANQTLGYSAFDYAEIIQSGKAKLIEAKEFLDTSKKLMVGTKDTVPNFVYYTMFEATRQTLAFHETLRNSDFQLIKEVANSPAFNGLSDSIMMQNIKTNNLLNEKLQHDKDLEENMLNSLFYDRLPIPRIKIGEKQPTSTALTKNHIASPVATAEVSIYVTELAAILMYSVLWLLFFFYMVKQANYGIKKGIQIGKKVVKKIKGRKSKSPPRENQRTPPKGL